MTIDEYLWDNTPHHPDLPGFPHHVHVEQEDQVTSSRPVSIFAVLDEVTRSLTPPTLPDVETSA